MPSQVLTVVTTARIPNALRNQAGLNSNNRLKPTSATKNSDLILSIDVRSDSHSLVIGLAVLSVRALLGR